MTAPQPAASRPVRWLFISLGSIALVLGVLGLFVPVVLPTTPFLLLAAWSYAKGSRRLHAWLVGHPRLGPILERWWADRSVPRRAKVYGIGVVWLGFGASIVWAVDALVLRLLLAALAVGVTLFLLTLRTWVPAPLPGNGPPVPPRDAKV